MRVSRLNAVAASLSDLICLNFEVKSGQDPNLHLTDRLLVLGNLDLTNADLLAGDRRNNLDRDDVSD